jgi:hypothetical protein
MTTRNGKAEWHGSVESGSDVAHSGCFTMALANGLSAAGHPPESLRTSARVQLRNRDGAITLARIDLETDGDVPGIDEREFQAYAEAAKWDCPVSRALAGIPEIILTAKLRTADSTDVPARSAQDPISAWTGELGPRRSRMRERTETRLVDRMISAYVEWREACRLVHDAYRSWASATAPRARVAFGRYTAARDAEERAAEVDARLVLRAGDLATSDDEISGPLAA